MIITLTEAEVSTATAIGAKREALRVSRGKGKRTPNDRGGSWLRRNAIGAIAEYAAAKHYGVLDRWLETQAYSLEHEKITADFGSKCQLRATDLPNGGLILHDYDTDGPYILALVEGSKVTLIGWMPARLARCDAYWRATGRGFSARPAYVVPQEDLLDINTLPMEAICGPRDA